MRGMQCKEFTRCLVLDIDMCTYVSCDVAVDTASDDMCTYVSWNVAVDTASEITMGLVFDMDM